MIAAVAGPIDPVLARFRARSAAAGCLLCAGVGWVNYYGLDEPLFASFALTGWLVRLLLAGSLGFVVAGAVTLASRRVGGGVAAVAAVLCAPAYFYVLDPALFGALAPTPHIGLPGDSYVLGEWAGLGLLTLVVMVFAYVRPPRRGRPRYRR